MRLKKRKASMAGAIYLIIGVLALMACVSIAISGEGTTDANTGIEAERKLDIETEKSEETPEKENEDDDETL